MNRIGISFRVIIAASNGGVLYSFKVLFFKKKKGGELAYVPKV